MTTDGARPIDPGRLKRAALRRAKRIGAGRFMIEGRHEPMYFVDLNEDAPCRCTDARMHGRPCLHELRARLSAGDDELVMMLGRLLDAADREAHTLRTRSDKQRSA